MEEIEGLRSRRPRPLPPPTAAAAAAAMFSVLGDDDLLREILLRLVHPTSLLRAALVCRRWYLLASDPAFLRRFRDRHPAPVLGVYLSTVGWSRPRFFPIRPHPELATVVRHAGSFFDAFEGSAFIHDSRGGRLLVPTFEDESTFHRSHLLCTPLSSSRNAIIAPPVPIQPPVELTSSDETAIIPQHYHCSSLPDGGDGRSYLSVLMGFGKQHTTVYLYELQDMCWVPRASAAAQLPVWPSRFNVKLLDNSKFCILTASNKILVCDFPSSSISSMELPDGVEINHSDSIMLSRKDGSGIYLIHVKESLLLVFSSDNFGNWFREHSICLREVCANLGMARRSPQRYSYGVKIHAVGDNAKFVFLLMFGTIVLLDIATKQAEKVYRMMTGDGTLISVHPLMLMWPPVFPLLKQGYNQ